jgi:hypothetical protein
MRADLWRKENYYSKQQNNSDWSGEDDGHWLVLARVGADEGDEWYSTLKGGRKRLELLLYGRKKPKKHKENK